MEKVKRVKKRKLNWKRVLILLLILYLIAMLLYTFFTMPIKNIYIKGTNLLTDNDIIEVANLKDYPAIFKISKSKLKKEAINESIVSVGTIERTKEKAK